MQTLEKPVQSEIIKKVVSKLDEQALAKQTKLVKQILFGAKQQGLKTCRERFFVHGELSEVSFEVPLNGRNMRLVYRYDPLNDSLVPVV